MTRNDNLQISDNNNSNNHNFPSWTLSDPSIPTKDAPLTSAPCYESLVKLFHETHPYVVAVATEASSHPTGLDALFAEPWVYAGGGLGNMQECPLQVCLAGGTSRDSFIFASLCVVPECTAMDLAAPDFVERLQTAASIESLAVVTPAVSTTREYLRLNQRIAELNKFLGTGWICGEYTVEWQVVPSTIYIACMLVLTALTIVGAVRKQFYHVHRCHHQHQQQALRDHDYSSDLRSQNLQQQQQQHLLSNMNDHVEEDHHDDDGDDDEEEKKESVVRPKKQEALCYNATTKHTTHASPSSSSCYFDIWSAWDMDQHWKNLHKQRPETACLDGLKVGSILWVIFGHVMAIQSSSGAGYMNPSDFLPPNGLTTKWIGQVLFSSRFAVDTFFCISGYLVVTVLRRKLPSEPTVGTIGVLLVLRILRMVPVYTACIGFWMFVAPHLGSGPFWYQWMGLLEPCQKWWWTNALFINNFVPFDKPTTDTCFYHSWYLAVDIQLFFLFGPWLVILYRKSEITARRVTIALWILSVGATAYLSYVRKWSSNTFDGAAVALYDVEAYAKPHARAQSYLTGMYVAMMFPSSSSRNARITTTTTSATRMFRKRDLFLLLASVSGLALVAFCTVTGAYARRACRYQEWPESDNCGSTWSTTTTFVYTAFSRPLWSICIAVVMALSLQRRGWLVEWFLSWKIWTPLAHLTFGTYLIHPIVIFIWQIGGKEKETFRLLSFGMDYIAVSVVSFVMSALAALIVELPFATLVQQWIRHHGTQVAASKTRTTATTAPTLWKEKEQNINIHAMLSNGHHHLYRHQQYGACDKNELESMTA